MKDLWLRKNTARVAAVTDNGLFVVCNEFFLHHVIQFKLIENF